MDIAGCRNGFRQVVFNILNNARESIEAANAEKGAAFTIRLKHAPSGR
jgi:nitrogen fixation/metabolism regulation signal transduction histidine kinase